MTAMDARIAEAKAVAAVMLEAAPHVTSTRCVAEGLALALGACVAELINEDQIRPGMGGKALECYFRMAEETALAGLEAQP